MLVSNFGNLDSNLNLGVFETPDDSIFVGATDFARKMGYGNPQLAIRTRVSPENTIGLGDLRGEVFAHPLRNQQPHTLMLNEPGTYELLFGSELPIARDFKKWVFERVIPSIRQTGAYHLPGALPKFGAITDRDFADEQRTKEFRNEMDTGRDQIKDKKNHI